MKFSLFIEYKIRNIFLEKSYTKCGSTKCGGEINPRPFSEKSKLSINLDQQSAWLVFIVRPSRRLPKYMKTKTLTTCFYLI